MNTCVYYLISPTYQTAPALFKHIIYANDKTCHGEQAVTANEVTSSDKISLVFYMQGAWIAICESTEAHPKQKEIFPELSQPGRGTCTEEETKRQDQEPAPDPQWGGEGGETCNYTSQRKQLPLPSHTKLSHMKRSHIRIFCVGPSVRFLYLLYRKHIDKSPVLAAKLSQVQ